MRQNTKRLNRVCRQWPWRLFSFCRRGRRPHVIASLSLAMSASLLGLAFEEELTPLPPPTTFVLAEEVFDNNDWEIQLTTSDGQILITDNEVEDRFPQISQSLAVWQRLGENGWEIMSWMVDDEEQMVTSDSTDDTEPATDGTYVVWQSLVDDRWQIFRLDARYPNGDPERLSDPEVNSLHPRVADGLTTWQAWIDNNWEIMSWSSLDGLSRLTINDQPDLEPDVSGAFLVWEGVDPAEGDRDIFAIDLATSTELIMTDNQSNDSGAEVDEDGQVEWFIDYGYGNSAITNTDLAQEFIWQQENGQLIEVVPTETDTATVEEVITETDTSTENSSDDNSGGGGGGGESTDAGATDATEPSSEPSTDSSTDASGESSSTESSGDSGSSSDGSASSDSGSSSDSSGGGGGGDSSSSGDSGSSGSSDSGGASAGSDGGGSSGGDSGGGGGGDGGGGAL